MFAIVLEGRILAVSAAELRELLLLGAEIACSQWRASCEAARD